jgi:hypothetical protein
MGAIKKHMDDNGISAIFIHHNRKARDDDAFNMILGSTGILGAADTALVITKGRNETNATLNITGRDIVQSQAVIRFNKKIFQWQLVGDARELAEKQRRLDYDDNPIVRTIKVLLDKSLENRWEGTATILNEQGKRITGSTLAPTPQKVGLALRGLGEQLLEYDKIIYGPSPNGNAGLIHRFHYLTDYNPDSPPPNPES